METLYKSDFVDDLCNAISEICAEPALKPQLMYRHVNLKGALERQLYFRFINDLNAQKIWAENSGHPAADRINLLRDFCRSEAAKKPVRSTLLLFASAVRDCAVELIKPFRKIQKQYHSAFIFNGEKFVRYFSLISSEFTGTSIAGFTGTTHRDFNARDVDFVSSSGCRWVFETLMQILSFNRVVYDLVWLKRMTDSSFEFLRTARPERLFCIEGNAPWDVIFCLCGNERGIRTTCIQQGWSPIIHLGFKNMPYNEMWVWGEGFARLLKPYNHDVSFRITGSPFIKSKPYQNHPHREKSPGLVLGAFLQGSGGLITHEKQQSLLNWLKFTANRNAKLTVLIRQHPSAPLNVEEKEKLVSAHNNITISSASDSTLEEFINSIDIGVSMFSTTLLECASKGIFTIMYNPEIIRNFQPNLVKSGLCYEAIDTEQLTEILDSVFGDKIPRPSEDAVNIYVSDFFAPWKHAEKS